VKKAYIEHKTAGGTEEGGGAGGGIFRKINDDF